MPDREDSFCYRAIRTRMGEALRTLFVPTEPSPKRHVKLLHALDQPKGDNEKKQDGDARGSSSEG